MIEDGEIDCELDAGGVLLRQSVTTNSNAMEEEQASLNPRNCKKNL